MDLNEANDQSFGNIDFLCLYRTWSSLVYLMPHPSVHISRSLFVEESALNTKFLLIREKNREIQNEYWRTFKK